VLHTIPSGIFHPDKINVIGNGVIIDPYTLAKEIKKLRERGAEPTRNLRISKRAHLIVPTHRLLDNVQEFAKGTAKIGSTLKGIGPAYTDKTARHGLRIGDVLSPDFKDRFYAQKALHQSIIQSYKPNEEILRIEQMSADDYEKLWFEGLEYISDIPLIDSEIYLNQSMKEGKKILAEGAQGAMLDVDFGTYPFVTSSNTITAGVCAGLGISPQSIGRVYGIFKAYCTRVGSGPFPTELFDETGDKLRKQGNEFGSTTGRPRRCGWIDLPALKYAIMLNGVTDLVMMKADVLDGLDQVGVCTKYKIGEDLFDLPAYETLNSAIVPVLENHKGWKTEISGFRKWNELPVKFREYIDYIETELNAPVTVVSLGPNREQTIVRKDI
jgi:adenylosuccinate synthase